MILNEGQYINGKQFIKDIKTVFGDCIIEKGYTSDYYRSILYKGLEFTISARYNSNPSKLSYITISTKIDNKNEQYAKQNIEYPYNIDYIKNLKQEIDNKIAEIKDRLGLLDIPRYYICYVKINDLTNYVEEEGYIQEDNTLGKKNTARKFTNKVDAENYKDVWNQDNYEIVEYIVEKI